MKLYDDRLHYMRKRIKGLKAYNKRTAIDATPAEMAEVHALMFDLEIEMAAIEPCLWTLFLRLFGVR